MTSTSVQMRQVVDWSAALWAGLISGTVFFLLHLLLFPLVEGGSPWIPMRYLASIVLGEGILPPPATFDITALLIGALVTLVLAILYTVVLAIIVYRWGLLLGIVIGAAFGLAVYAINYYTLTLFFPWFFAMHSVIVAVIHVIFGAVAGGVYELLEVEEFVVTETA